MCPSLKNSVPSQAEFSGTETETKMSMQKVYWWVLCGPIPMRNCHGGRSGQGAEQTAMLLSKECECMCWKFLLPIQPHLEIRFLQGDKDKGGYRSGGFMWQNLSPSKERKRQQKALPISTLVQKKGNVRTQQQVLQARKRGHTSNRDCHNLIFEV